MCTAVSYHATNHYFGRNLDLEYSYNETVTITPRNYEFTFRKAGKQKNHYAIIGMAYVVDDYPLYYDATNEKGVSMAGLNFPGNAYYQPTAITGEAPGTTPTEGGPDEAAAQRHNIAPFEFIPWVLGQCTAIAQVKELLSRINLVEINFSEKLPLTPLHWMISDRDSSITVEAMRGGLKIHDNPVGVLTNNPPFEYQIFNLNRYMSLTREAPEARFAPGLQDASGEKAASGMQDAPGKTVAAGLSLSAYSRGMGALGLPGDLSSDSRFVRAAFVKLNSIPGSTEAEDLSQFFHILGAVEQQKGCVHIGNNNYELTVYSSCCNTDKGIYYYTTYNNRQITGVDMHRENLDGSRLVSYPLVKEQQIMMQ